MAPTFSLLAVLGLLAAAPALAAQNSVTVTCTASSASSCSLVAHPPGVSVPSSSHSSSSNSASATLSDAKVSKSGWYELSVDVSTVSPSSSDLSAAYYAAGVAEGALTCSEFALFSFNMLTSTFGWTPGAGPSPTIQSFIDSNDQFVRGNIAANRDTDDYWLSMSNLYSQMDGFLSGLNDFSPCAAAPDFVPYTYMDILLVNLDGDLFDLMTAYPEADDEASASQLAPLPRSHPTHHVDRCSALFKYTGSDVFFAHDTWDTYATAAPRIFKTLSLPVLRGGVLGRHVDSFSSSPGFLASIDDYYLISGTSELSVIETSLEVYNTTIYEALTPESVFCFARTMVANMLATGGESWSDLFSVLHSGTYNNQWMVLDATKFAPSELPPAAAAAASMAGLFWVLEESPGLIHAEDQTAALLESGYWGSYNVAFYPVVRAHMGEVFSYERCPRADLFREFQASVVDISSLQTVMTWNDYRHDPYSRGRASNAIMSRYDLLPVSPAAAGGIDSKCSSLKERTQGLRTFARAGMTYGDVPVFCWGDPQFEDTPHEGHPKCFEYAFEEFYGNVVAEVLEGAADADDDNGGCALWKTPCFFPGDNGETEVECCSSGEMCVVNVGCRC